MAIEFWNQHWHQLCSRGNCSCSRAISTTSLSCPNFSPPRGYPVVQEQDRIDLLSKFESFSSSSSSSSSLNTRITRWTIDSACCTVWKLASLSNRRRYQRLPEMRWNFPEGFDEFLSSCWLLSPFKELSNVSILLYYCWLLLYCDLATPGLRSNALIKIFVFLREKLLWWKDTETVIFFLSFYCFPCIY